MSAGNCHPPTSAPTWSYDTTMTFPSDSPASLETIKARLREFTRVRDWDQFHSPKNLVMALVSEIGELVEVFQWLTEEESRNLSDEGKTSVRDELADILIYLIMISEKLGIDLLTAVNDKITKNEGKYPPEKARGSSKKYTEL